MIRVGDVLATTPPKVPQTSYLSSTQHHRTTANKMTKVLLTGSSSSMDEITHVQLTDTRIQAVPALLPVSSFTQRFHHHHHHLDPLEVQAQLTVHFPRQPTSSRRFSRGVTRSSLPSARKKRPRKSTMPTPTWARTGSTRSLCPTLPSPAPSTRLSKSPAWKLSCTRLPLSTSRSVCMHIAPRNE